MCEIALRAYYAHKNRTVEQVSFIERDDRLGWKATANYYVRYRVRSGDGAEQTVTYSSVENGFRVLGDVNTTRPKVLFIGDSFTKAVNIAGVPDTLVDMEAQGAVVKDFDGAHWNELGHMLVAEEVRKSAVFTLAIQ